MKAAAPALLFALVAAAGAPKGLAADSVVPSSIVVDLDGMKRSMRQSRGRVLVVHFWATWCLPCLDELPIISKFAGDMKPRGLDVLSLSLDNPETGAPRVRQVLANQAPNLAPLIVKVDDPDQFINAFDRRWEGTIPALFAFDPAGQLRRSHIGEANRAELQKLVDDLLKGQTKAGAGKK